MHVGVVVLFPADSELDVSMDPTPLTLFYSYAREDKRMRNRVDAALAPLKRDDLIATWYDGMIEPGEEWDEEIKRQLDSADIILLLLSIDFLNSGYIDAVEVKRAMKRHEDGTARVIPVLLRYCHWKRGAFAKLQGVPDDFKPVEEWRPRSKAYTRIAEAVETAATRLQEIKAATNSSGTAPSPTLWTIPPSTQTFTGRATILKQVDRLLAAGDRVALAALAGLGGVGKTEVALEYARQNRTAYDVGWFVKCEEPGVLRSDLTALAVALELSGPTDGPEAAVAALQRWWAANDRWLLVYDNAERAEDLDGLLPTAGGGHVLITSRAQAWGGTAKKVKVGVLPRKESIALLLKRAEIDDPTDDQRAAADRLAAALGDLPLALEQAAAYVDEAGISFDAYLDRFRERRTALFDDPEADDRATVTTTWSLSFERAEAESPAAGGLLRLCACLAPDDIPADLIRQSETPWPGPLDAVRTDGAAWDAALKALRRHSLVRTDADDLSVHRLVQAVTWDRMDGGERETWATVAQRFLDGLINLDDSEMVVRLGEVGRLVPHALIASDFKEGDAPIRSRLLDRVATFSQFKADYAEAEDLFRAALEIDETIREPDYPTVAVRVNNLGGVLRTRGDLGEAEDAYRRALAIGEAAYGIEHPIVAIYANNLGNVLHDRGHLGEAEDASRRALAIGEAAYGIEHPTVAIYANNLGSVLRDRGDLDGAEDAYRRALAIHEAAYGPDHPQVAIGVNNLGSVLRARGDLNGAKDAFRRAIFIDEAAYGPDHPTVAISVNNLGSVLLARGDLDGAENAYRRALAIGEAAYGPDHPAIAIRVNNLGAVLRARGDLNGAEDAYRRALAIFERVLGPDHPNTQGVRDNLEALR